MKKIVLLIYVLAVASAAFAAEQVYFKIAVNENEYATFLTDRISTKKSILQYLALNMRQPFFKPESIDKDYYEIQVNRGIKFFDKDVVQYNVIPLKHDRFRHVMLVDEKDDIVIRKEVYDNDGKLVFSFTNLERSVMDQPPQAGHASVKEIQPAFKGYFLVMDKKLEDGTKHQIFSDGLNRFSVFRKKTDIELPTVERILYGNYIYRESVGRNLYTIVGSLPFSEMKLLVENISLLEEKK